MYKFVKNKITSTFVLFINSSNSDKFRLQSAGDALCATKKGEPHSEQLHLNEE